MVISSKDGTKWSKGKWSKAYTIGELVSPSDKQSIERDYKVNWNEQMQFSYLWINDMIWDGKRFVATAKWQMSSGTPKKKLPYDYPVANVYGSLVMTSTDGSTWSATITGNYGGSQYENSNTLIYTGKEYVLVSFTVVNISKDLKTWKTYYPVDGSRTSFSLNDVLYANGKFIAIGWDPGVGEKGWSGVIYTSKDGVNWKEEKTKGLSNRIVKTIFWDGTQYWIGGGKGMLLRSSNLIDWEYWKDGMTNPFETNDWPGEYANINKIIYDGKHYILVGNRGTIILTDKFTKAEIVRQRLGGDYQYADYDGGNRYVAAGNMVDLVESQDGYDWRPAVFNNPDDIKFSKSNDFKWEGVAAGNGVVLAYGDIKIGFNHYYERYAYSSHPGEWEWRDFPVEIKYFDRMEYQDGKFYVYYNNGYIASTDGMNWSEFVKLNSAMDKVVSNGKIMIGLGEKTTVKAGMYQSNIYTSLDGVKWKQVQTKQNNTSISLYMRDISWSGKQFIGIGMRYGQNGASESAVFSSLDGVSWNYKVTNVGLDSIACSQQACVAAGGNGGDLYTFKGDLSSFKVSSRPTQYGIAKVLWDGKKFIALGENGTIQVSQRPNRVSVPTDDQIVPFWIKYDNEEAQIEFDRKQTGQEAARQQEAAPFRAEAEKRVAAVKQIGIDNGYDFSDLEQSDEWVCSLHATEWIQYEYFKSGEYRNKFSFVVYFNGIDHKQLTTTSEIIAAHTGASKDEVNTALQTIVNGNADANGVTQVGGVAMKYNLTLARNQAIPMADLEIGY